jgi:putative Mg2+ transporter-C (MgtC) family protein
MLDDAPTVGDGLRVGLAVVLALPVGWERERTCSTGLRTYPLVSACVCGFMLIAQRAFGRPGELADVFFGVLAGIGFVGAGAIMRTPRRSAGMGTAVSLWLTGAIGMGVALGSPLTSAALSLLAALALWAISRVAPRKETS